MESDQVRSGVALDVVDTLAVATHGATSAGSHSREHMKPGRPQGIGRRYSLESVHYSVVIAGVRSPRPANRKLTQPRQVRAPLARPLNTWYRVRRLCDCSQRRLMADG